jgi:hypothetical protein
MKNFIILFIVLASCTNKDLGKDIAYNLKSFPCESIQLTETDSGKIIYNTCDAGNGLVRVSLTDSLNSLLLYGRQEDYSFDILTSFISANDTISLQLKWSDSNDSTVIKITWLNKAAGIWEMFWNGTSHTIYVDDEKSKDYVIYNQPCRECWEDECDYLEKLDSIREASILTIKHVFGNYVEYQESTDSKENKDAMMNAIQSLEWIYDEEEFEILINVWMYYDPTDFQGIPDVYKILVKNKSTSIKAIRKRINNKKEWENEGSAPYSDLPGLIKRIEKE